MNAPTCPYCGDGMESVGTLNHIECVVAIMAERDRTIEALRVCGNCTGRELHHDPYGECEESCDNLSPVDRETTHEDAFTNDWPQHGGPRGTVEAQDHCYWAISRWIARAEEGGGDE